ncbi:MAG: SUMF1/EgtB/PvdO family nonheme iron enzyme [Polyangiaceae bacterium]
MSCRRVPTSDAAATEAPGASAASTGELAAADEAAVRGAAAKEPAAVAVSDTAPGANAVAKETNLVAAPTAALDPPGFRSFDDPAARLPPRPKRPAYTANDDACPEGMVLVEGLRCTVPVQECLEWVDEPGKPNRACGRFREPSRCAGARHPMRFCIDRTEYTPEGWALPLVHVSWNEASLVCSQMGKRLCSEGEWEFACEGPDATPYPYGYVRDGARCNHDRDELFTPRGKLIDRRRGALDTPDCKSPFGVLNLVGNVDEWTTRPENEAPHRSILRGGWWLKGRNRCRASTSSHSEIYAGPQTGFRCCQAARRTAK